MTVYFRPKIELAIPLKAGAPLDATTIAEIWPYVPIEAKDDLTAMANAAKSLKALAAKVGGYEDTVHVRWHVCSHEVRPTTPCTEINI